MLRFTKASSLVLCPLCVKMSLPNCRTACSGISNVFKHLSKRSTHNQQLAVISGSGWRGQPHHCRAASSLSNNSPEANAQNNDYVNPNFINRNPRNLEQMGLAIKRQGWRFTYPGTSFHHRLVFDVTNKHTQAYVEHKSGNKVLMASTKELAIAKHLYSNTDVSAAENIGRVLAARCRESGITSMVMDDLEHDLSSAKFSKFLEALTDGGIELSEPETEKPDYEPGINYEDPEEVADLHERQVKAGTFGTLTERAYRARRRQRKATNKPIKVVAPPLVPPSHSSL